MSAKDTLNKIAAVLGMESKKEELAEQEPVKVEFAQMRLENGTVLEAEAFEAGNDVFIVSNEERVAVPVGEYEMEDGQILVVQEEGVIAEIKAAESEESEEEELEEDKMEYATKQEMSEIKAMVEDLVKKVEEMGKKEEPKEEMSSQVVEEETPALKHSPEREERKVKFRYEANRPMSVQDRIFNKLSNK